MFTVSRALEKALLQHFIYEKLAIAYAINKPFPFFESLRDKSFITEQMYSESLEAWRHLVPVSRVVYNILSKLEKTFNLSLLATMFSQTNLCEYPNLRAILRSFINVGAAYGEWSKTALAPLKALADPGEGSSLQTLLQLPPPQPPLPSRLSCATRVTEPRASSRKMDETPNKLPNPSASAVPLPGRVPETRSTPVTNDNLICKIKEKEDAQEMPRSLPVSSSDDRIPPKKDKEDAQEMSHAPSGPIPVIRDDSPEPNAPEEPQEALSTPPNKKGRKRPRCIWSSPRKRHKKKTLPRGAASSGHGIQKLQVVGQKKDNSTSNLKTVSSVQRARMEYDQTSKSEENPKEEVVDFLSPTLPVTCGDAKGIFYKEKMGPSGSLQKCIQNEKGAWFTPDEFVIQGKGKKSKDWKRSMHCGGKTLRQLLEKGFLLCSPKRKLKKGTYK